MPIYYTKREVRELVEYEVERRMIHDRKQLDLAQAIIDDLEEALIDIKDNAFLQEVHGHAMALQPHEIARIALDELSAKMKRFRKKANAT